MPDAPRSAVSIPTQLELVTLGSTSLRAVSAPNHTPEAGLGPPARDAIALFDLGKPLALITYIACAPERCVPREHLIDLLWGDVEPDAAKHALRQTLWYIRKRLGDRPLIAGGDTLSIISGLDCDRDRLLAAVTDGDAESVVRLYAGEFFPEFAAPGGAEFERWADLERQRLRGFFWRSAETLVRRWMTSGRLRDAQVLARRVRDSDVLRESGWRLLFETLVASGDAVTGALEADAFDRLATSEGIEAEPATRSLLRLVRQQPSPTPGTTTGDWHPSLFAELVGREQEFAQLLASWEAARGGRTSHVHVVAPAGLGKTRLLTDVNARLRATRVRTVFIRASLGARDIPFGLAADLAEALAQLPGASGISTGSARTLVALNPALSASYPAAAPEMSGDGADAIRRRSVAVRELVAAVAEEQPVAVFVDDMQWADVRSRQLITTILDALEHARVLLVTASRPAPDAQVSSERSLTIRLAPLDEAAIAALLASIAAMPSELWAERLPTELCDATGGSPLLVLETIQLAIEGGLLVRGDTWRAPHTGRLFATLGAGGALRQRVERLDRLDRWVMTLLAVAGVPLARASVAAAAERSDDEVTAALGNLDRRGLVARHGDHWSPSHDEIAAVVLELAAPDARHAAARSLGKMLLDNDAAGTRTLRQAGALLADAGDRSLLGAAFTRFVRLARDTGDRRGNRELADDFLGERSAPGLAGQLVRALPTAYRSGLYSTRRQLAAIGAVALAPLVMLVVQSAVRQPPPDVVLAIGSVGLDSAARMYRIPVRASQLGSSAIIDAGVGRPAWRFVADPAVGDFVSRPDGKAWAIARVSNDSGGIDLFEVSEDGRERRLTSARGDDQNPSWSPDGKYLAFFTARWNANSYYDLAVLDRQTLEVRPLTRGDESDMWPVWSPDGSRIAFTRRYWDGRPSAVCVIDVDAHHERCLTTSANTTTLGAWYDTGHVVIDITAGQRRFVGRLDVASGAIDTLFTAREGDAIHLSPDGRWVLCGCRRVGYAPNAVLLFQLDDPNRVAEIDVQRLDTRRRFIGFERAVRSGRYAERIVIDTSDGEPMVGVAHRLTAHGVAPNGDVVPLGAVRWTLLDTTMATVDESGLLQPKRAGTVRVSVSAGGWRTATRVLVITARDSATLLAEDWSRGIGAAWRAFGAPRPRTESAPNGFAAFLNNGEGSFNSGVYSAAKYSTARGLALDAWASVPIASMQWQTITLALDPELDDAGLARWDHVNGSIPRRDQQVACEFGYPSGENAAFGDSLRIFSGRSPGSHAVHVPPSFRTGSWFHVRIQVFPDGRCGVAVNGVPVGLSQVAAIDNSPVRVLIFGNSVNTKVLVGPVTVRAGVPGDIDWSRVSDTVPNVPPPGWSPDPRPSSSR